MLFIYLFIYLAIDLFSSLDLFIYVFSFLDLFIYLAIYLFASQNNHRMSCQSFCF